MEYSREIRNAQRYLEAMIPGDVQDGLTSAALDRSEKQQYELKQVSREIPSSENGLLEKATRRLDAVQGALREEANAKRP